MDESKFHASQVTTVRLCGLLVANKPRGWSSRRAVDVVQQHLPRRTKVGHAGTLDPLAEGVLVITVGPATRLTEFLQRMPKTYRASFLLGCTSETDDVEGDVHQLPEARTPRRDELQAELPKFTGRIEQRPPAFSALKVAGQRAYALSRAGQPVDLPARPIEVYHLQIEQYDYPRLVLQVCCGAGTYIRALGRDLAASVGSGAVMSALTRTAIGPFQLESALDVRQLRAETIQEHLQPALAAVAELPRTTVSAPERMELAHGRTILRPEVTSTQLAAVDRQGDLCAILVPRGQGHFGPRLNFLRVGAGRHDS